MAAVTASKPDVAEKFSAHVDARLAARFEDLAEQINALAEQICSLQKISSATFTKLELSTAGGAAAGKRAPRTTKAAGGAAKDTEPAKILSNLQWHRYKYLEDASFREEIKNLLAEGEGDNEPIDVETIFDSGKPKVAADAYNAAKAIATTTPAVLADLERKMYAAQTMSLWSIYGESMKKRMTARFAAYKTERDTPTGQLAADE